MKKALKVIGWGLLLVIGLAIFLNLDRIAQAALGVLGIGYWALHDFEKRAEAHRKMLDYRLTAIEQKLDSLLNHPLNTRYIVDGIESMVDEHLERQRARSGDSHRP